jgi:hypothetical protein
MRDTVNFPTIRIRANFLNTVFDHDKDFPAVTPAGAI